MSPLLAPGLPLSASPYKGEEKSEEQRMARYEHLPIYKTAMDLAVYLEQVVRNFTGEEKGSGVFFEWFGNN